MTTQRAPGRILPIAFPGITPAEVQELIFNSQIRNYPAQTALCHENALEDTFYILLEGRVEVTKSIDDNETRLLKILEAGDFFGEMALIHNAPRSATVKSVAPVVVMEIKREAFDRVLRQSSSVSLAMVHEISDRLRRNDQMAIEDLRMRAGELAEAYQKLAEQDFTRREFLTNVAHELRTPLTSASGFLQLLNKKVIPEDQVPTVLEKVERNVQQIVHLVNDILFLQEMDLVLPEFQELQLGEILHSVVESLRERAEKQGIHLRVTGTGKVPPARPHPARAAARQNPV